MAQNPKAVFLNGLYFSMRCCMFHNQTAKLHLIHTTYRNGKVLNCILYKHNAVDFKESLIQPMLFTIVLTVCRRFHSGMPVYFSYNRDVSNDADDYHIKQDILVTHLNIDQAQASLLMNKYNLAKVDGESLEEKIKYLLNYVPPDHLKENAWLLNISLYTIKEKLKLLSKFEDNAACHLQLLKLSERQLKLLAKWDSNISSRLTYLSTNLEISVKELMNLLEGSRLKILKIDLHKMKNILEMLKDAGVTPDAIKKDMWIFKHNEDLISKRLSELKSAGVIIKPWQLRCPEEVYLNSIKLQSAYKKVLGPHRTSLEYLAKRLQCSVKFLEFITERQTNIRSISPPKLKEALDFLLEKQFTTQQILNAPRVLQRSVKTLRKRLTELEALDFRPKSLLTLCQSKKEHERLITALKHLKK